MCEAHDIMETGVKIHAILLPIKLGKCIDKLTWQRYNALANKTWQHDRRICYEQR